MSKEMDMKSMRRDLSVIAVTLVLSVSLARGEERPGPSGLPGKIANWPAPPFWSPPTGDVRTMGRIAAAAGTALPFIAIEPCRLVDTRQAGFPAGFGSPALAAGVPRNFDLNSDPLCPGIASNAGAYSLNVTVTNTLGAGFLLIFPQGLAQPAVSTLNYVAGQTVANAAIVPAGAGGGVTVIAGVSGTDLIIDINGYYAGAVPGDVNTFVGLNAGNDTMTGDSNTGVGAGALQANTTGSFNTATGTFALQSNTTGDDNTADGDAALGKNETGIFNTATGSLAMASNVSGGGNTAAGRLALFSNESGNANTAVGAGALSNTTGSNNIGIGLEAGENLTTGNDNICIGTSGVAGEAGTIRIGSGGKQTATFIAGISGAASPGGVAVFVTATGKLGTVTSSRRFKEDVREIGEESDALMRLRPVAFRYKPEIDPEGLTQYGLIAEEVADVYPELVVDDPDGRPETVRYHLVNALLLNEVQKQHRIAESQEKTIEQLKAEIEELRARLANTR
jgi:hypothetical protein